MYIDLAELVTSAISHIGREDILQNNKIDNHSAITISLHEMPDINIFMVDEMPMIWSVLSPKDELNTALHSEIILSKLMDNTNQYFYFGQPALLNINDYIELRAVFSPFALKNGESTADAINTFVSFMSKIINLCKQ